MSVEKTLVLLKPCTVQRALIGEVISRFEKKGLRIVGLKFMQLDDAILTEHYAHLAERPFFPGLKESMMVTPVVALALEGIDAIEVVRQMAGATNGRKAQPGTIRGDYSMSGQQNIVHASDGPESAEVELRRFFREGEIFDWVNPLHRSLYATDEC
ncbi:MAG: nucleoside-diphosphate kinase [Bacteroidaceae bacterium]|nr:nucleoside-diphosphate kinase [Bacteroidaceae bacterium]